MIPRKKTRQVRVGNVRIGGGAPISIQSMAKTRTSQIEATVSEISRLEEAGCEIVRIAVKDDSDAAAICKIKDRIKIPLVADIHFNYRLALKAIENGIDKIRLNPGNISDPKEVALVVKAAKKAKIPIRIGVNSGSLANPTHSTYEVGTKLSFPRKRESRFPIKAFGNDMFRPRRSNGLGLSSALGYIKLFERLDFHDIVISLKASDVASTVTAYRKISEVCDYPLHLGVTAAGPYDTGIIKSSIGIGALLLDGIGDTLRVSLTAPAIEEVIAARRILNALNIRRFGPNIISCPTCGRCQVDLAKIVRELEKRLAVNDLHSRAHLSVPYCGKRGVTIAVMGCEVNGPGEAKEADIGIAFGKNFGILFRKGKVIKRVAQKDAVKELIEYAMD